MTDIPLTLDVSLGVTIPARAARGRAVRLGKAIDSILANHAYPPVIEELLAEALALTALLGSLLKDSGGQMTLQAQTENGIVDLLVCDYLGGELRGYVRHDSERLVEAGPNPSLFALFGKGYLAITFDQPSTKERYQGIVPLEGDGLGQAAESYFTQSEQIPSIVRLAAAKDEQGWTAGGIIFQHLPEGEEAARRGARRIGQAGRIARPHPAARRVGMADVPRGRGSARLAPGDAQARLPLRPRLRPFGDRPLPGRGARGDGRRRRLHPGRLRVLRDRLPDFARRYRARKPLGFIY